MPLPTRVNGLQKPLAGEQKAVIVLYPIVSFIFFPVALLFNPQIDVYKNQLENDNSLNR